MEITEATDNYVPEILDLWKEFMDFHKNIDPYFSRSKDGHLHWKKHLRDLMRSNDDHVLVVLDKGHPVGYSISKILRDSPIFEHERYGFISYIWVQPSYRRKRIGDGMLAKILDWLSAHNIDRVELDVIARNEIGYSFWKKHGFKDYRHRLYLDRG